MPKFPVFSLFAALIIVTFFSLAASAEDRSPVDMSADVTAVTPDISVHAPGVAVKTGGVSTNVKSDSSSYTEKHVDLPNGHSTVIHKEEHAIGAIPGAASVGIDSDMTVDDEE